MEKVQKKLRKLPFSIIFIATAVIIAVAGGGIFIYQSNLQDQNTQVDEIQEQDSAIEAEVVTVSIDDGENQTNYSVDFQEGKYAYDVIKNLSEVEEDFSVEFQEFDFGYFVVAINGNKPEVSEAFWKFVVNGEDASVGIGDYEVEAGDSLGFVLDQVE